MLKAMRALTHYAAAGIEGTGMRDLRKVGRGARRQSARWQRPGSVRRPECRDDALTQPIFQGGRLKNNVRFAEAQREQQLLTYQQTIQGAFRDVSNALVGYRKLRKFRLEQEQLVASAQDAAQLSQTRFTAGKTDYLEVLTNETNAFTAELNLAQPRGNELLALVPLYQALGGG
jgi:outer membrane protein TolC